jgi:hypothetical protein
VEGSTPACTEKETANTAGAGNVEAQAPTAREIERERERQNLHNCVGRESEKKKTIG